MRSIACVGNNEFMLGFQLAGIARAITLNDNDPDKTIQSLIEDESLGLVVIEESSVKSLGEEMQEKITHSIEPVFLTITEHDSNRELARLIKKSIGVDLWKDGNQ